MGESTKSFLTRYWPLITQLLSITFVAGMGWNMFQQTREEQRVQSAQIAALELRIREGEKIDQMKAESIIRLEEQVKVLVFEVQQLRHRLEDKKIVFQAGSDNNSTVGGPYHERP